MQGAEIFYVEPGGLADELGLLPGDKILRVNGEAPLDIIDLSFLLADEEIELLVEHIDGESEIISFDKDVEEELGAEFESAVFDGVRRCRNNCLFCFVNMLPPNMRQSLYVKDDDYRLSFLYGNFITLTNMKEEDLLRIKRLNLSPLFVSVQATNPAVREKLLRKKEAGRIEEMLTRLEEAGASYHAQVVLVKNVNDGEELKRTIADIARRRPHALSLAIVPVGVTKYRRDPFPIESFTQDDAKKIIDEIGALQRKFRAETGRSFVYLSDEFYLLAGRELPPAEEYDGFPQLENGIGLASSFLDDYRKAERSSHLCESAKTRQVVISGTSFAKVLTRLVKEAMEKEPNLQVDVLPVENQFFGSRVNVSGLLTGGDMLTALKKYFQNHRADVIILPKTALRRGEDVFLDDMTLEAFCENFPFAKIKVVGTGADFFESLVGG